MTSKEFVPQVLPGSTRSLADGVPPAPPGTIFALAADGGFAVPPRKFTLHFGRGTDDVHVPIGVNDPYVSRLHGVLVCDGRTWWIRNKGKLPIQLPGEAMLLSGHELLIEPGYTPLFIGSAKRRSHLLEIHVVASRTTDTDGEHHSRTKAPDVYDLSLVERLVLTALAQRYLRQERYPQPVSWSQVADDLNQLPDGRQLTPKIAAHIVGACASGWPRAPTLLHHRVLRRRQPGPAAGSPGWPARHRRGRAAGMPGPGGAGTRAPRGRGAPRPEPAQHSAGKE